MNWKQIAFVPANANGADNNNYIFYDENPEQGRSYYRLKMLSSDGSYQYSAVRTVDIKKLNGGMRLWPNPARTFTSVTFTSDRNETGTISVSAGNGIKVIHKPIMLTRGMNQVPLENLSTLTPGVYVVQVTTPGNTMSVKLTIQ